VAREEREHISCALALSGGGFRATLFHTGALIRLNELGLLRRLDCISGVSGGAINAGLLGARWARLRFDETGRAANLHEEIVLPLRRLCARRLDVLPSFANMAGMLLGLPSTALAAEYDRQLYHGFTLGELTKPGEGPLIVLTAGSLVTGAEVFFRGDALEEKRLGRVRLPHLKLATAVAASSAYPPFLSPVVIPTDPDAWEPLPGADLHGESRLRQRLTLTDGGVYDALAVEPVWREYATLLVSDGCVAKGLWRPGSFWPRQWLRVILLTTSNTAAIRKELLSEFVPREGPRAGGRACIYWGNGTRIASYGVEDALCQDSDITRGLARMRTRLGRFTPREQGWLINWGYALCDAAMRRSPLLWQPPPMPAREARLPVPECSLS